MCCKLLATKALNTVGVADPGPGEVIPYMGYIGMCGPKGYGFSAVLLLLGYRFSLVLAILVVNRVWFLYSSLDIGMFLTLEATFSSLSK